MCPKRWELILETTSPEETEEAGEILGRRLTGGEVIALEGSLGLGKTTFIRGLAQGLGIREMEIASPTFVFLHEHQGRLPLAHLDLFRIERSEDLPDLGILDYLEGPWVVAIEWAEKATGILPFDRLTIRISEAQDERHRRLVLSTSSTDGQALLRPLRERFCGLKKS